MKMSASAILKRFFAYFIDMFIISLVVMLLSMIPQINPNYDAYQETGEKVNELMEQYQNEEIDSEEYIKQNEKLSYELNKNGYIYIGIQIVLVFSYFGVYAYFAKGQTLGKRIMKLKIVSNKDKELKLTNYFFRILPLYGVIANFITLIAIFFSRGTYLKITNISSYFTITLESIIIVMILLNNEGRGLHDVIAGTKVIDLKEEAKRQELNKEETGKTEIIKPDKDA